MRRRRIATQVVRRDEWEAHEQVVVKGLNVAEVAYINDIGNGGGLTGTTQLYTVLFGVSRWTLTNEQGQGLPWPDISLAGSAEFDHAAIKTRLHSLADLMQEDVNFLTREIGKINAPNSKEEQEAFLATASSTAGATPSAVTASSLPPSESAI